jgi:chromosomal replication initiator protein
MTPEIYIGTFKKLIPLGKLTKEEILKAICKELQMDFNEVKNRKTRLREFVYARQLYAYFCKEYTNESLKKIGKFIHKNHATIIHSINQIKGYYDYDKVIKNDVDKINTTLEYKFVDYTPKERDLIAEEIILKYQN